MKQQYLVSYLQLYSEGYISFFITSKYEFLQLLISIFIYFIYMLLNNFIKVFKEYLIPLKISKYIYIECCNQKILKKNI